MQFVKAVLEQQPEGRHLCRRTSTISPLMVSSTVTCPKSVAEFFSNSKAPEGDEGGDARKHLHRIEIRHSSHLTLAMEG
jgi:hypothetical protein